ncbi:ABC transporter permease [Acidobacteriota bacterium]
MRGKGKKPPRAAQFLLKRLANRRETGLILGDLEEEFNDMVESKGPFRAFFWYWILLCISTPSFVKEHIYWRMIMIRNYLKIAFRNISKHKWYSSMNIFGLAIGMACCILILLFVQDELKYDRFHEKGDRIGRVVTEFELNGKKTLSALTQAPLAQSLQDDFPEILEAATFNKRGGGLLRYIDKVFQPRSFQFTDPSFFRIFSHEFLKGDPKTALENPHSLVLTDDIAEKYFGTEEPMGKVLEVDNGPGLQVTGVIRKPKNTHIDLSHVVSIQLYRELGQDIDTWQTFNYTTYILIPEGTQFEEMETKIASHMDKYWREDNNTKFRIQPLTRIYLHSNLSYDVHTQTSSILVVYLLSMIAVFVLIIACVNFMNLSTARYERRAREVGLRKVIGAHRRQLIFQFIGESIVLAGLSVLIAAFLVELILPSFNSLALKELRFFSSIGFSTVLGLVSIAILTGFIAGSYPAFFLSGFKPVATLKGTPRNTGKGRAMRRFLVICQFFVSIVLVISTVLVYKQLRFMQNKNLGYDKEHVVCFNLNPQFKDMYDSFKNELLQNPSILNVTAIQNIPNWAWPSYRLTEWDGREEGQEFSMRHGAVEYDFFETMKMEIIKGRGFSRAFPADRNSSLIINEEAVRQMGMEDPIGKEMAMIGYKGRIIGIVKDFHFDTVRQTITPLVLELAPQTTQFMLARISPRDIPNSLQAIERTWGNFVKGYNFSFVFLDAAIDRNYQLEIRLGQIVTFFTALALFIACLGLFGLASFTAERRTKEIGIRKALGAGVSSVVVLLSKEFTKWVLVACLLACPVAYFISAKLLNQYAYRTSIGIFVFILPALLSMLLAILTVSYQAVRAAMTNPAKSLRYE